MKRIFAIIMMVVAIGVGAAIAQQDPSELKLRKGSQINGTDYTYVSPWMLKNMKMKELKELKGIPIEHVDHIEILKTKWNGLNRDFKSLMNDLTNEPGFVLVGFDRNDDKGVKICIDQSGDKGAYGLSSDDSDIIHRILITMWAGYGSEHTLIYIVGRFTPEEVQSLIHF